MPSWNIHLEVGERISKKLKYSEDQKEEFLLGCILPDINNGYINKVRTLREHGETHWTFDQKSSLNFYAKYKKEIDEREPIFMGYLVHLYTDGFFNYDFYHNVKRSEFAGLPHEVLCEIKHHDFWKYDLNFRDRKFFVSDKPYAVERANLVEGVDIDEEELLEVEAILANDELNKDSLTREYRFYDKEKLDKVMDEMIASFTKDYLDA